MPSLRRLIVPRGVAKVLHPVNLPSVRSIVTPDLPSVPQRRRKPRRSR